MPYDIDFWDYSASKEEEDKDFEFPYESKILIDYYYHYAGEMIDPEGTWFIKDTINKNNSRQLITVIPKTELIIRKKDQLLLLLKNKSYGFFSLETFNKFNVQIAYWQT